MTKTLCCNSFQSAWPKEYNVAIDDAIVVTWSWLEWYHMKKKLDVYLILFVDLSSAMVPLIISLASCAANTGTNGTTWPKLCCTSFQLSWPWGCNGALIILTASHDQWHHMTNKFIILTWGMEWCHWPCCWNHMTPNQCQGSWHRECNSATDNVIGFKWCQCQCKWHSMTKVMLHLILTIPTKGMEWCH